ncbi:MAG: TRAP transporter permease DctM/Q [Rhodospirillaceae bacterium]|nr:TRAP transporter permease DctM/Q [Rhodospirillaceae bacterium]
MRAVVDSLQTLYLAAIIILGVSWVIDVPQYFGVSFISAEWMGPLLSLGIAAAFLKYPYAEKAGLFEVFLGILAILGWAWMSLNYSNWIIDIFGYTPDKFLPGIIAILLLMEALRKAAGLPITILVWVLIAYGFLGYLMPQPFQAEQFQLPRLVMYLYADTNGIPGQVLSVVGRLVLAFIVLGKLMEVTGATKFFTDLALAAMGHKRGGPAKVAVIASSIFGSINGTSVGNIMSTGIVTIPLMKKSGFRAHYAAAIEAVASNGGQFAPPVMGATAFLIAEFLQISYTNVVIAAAVPAALYYVCLFSQVDAIALRDNLSGLPRDELPDAANVMRNGWVFLLPLGVLLYLLFWRGFNPAVAALWAVGALLVLSVIRNRRFLKRDEWRALIVDGGANMLPLLMIGGGAGVVIGVMNLTGLGFSLSLVLTQIGENAGTLVMLMLTGVISIILGMGMPTAAIYVVLSVILAPAIVEMGVSPIAAHLFIFYFGLLSFLTPPVAIASFVAAGIAESKIWPTSWSGVQLAAVAYLLPFLWCYNEAILLQGTSIANSFAVITTLVAVLLIAKALQMIVSQAGSNSGKGVLLFAGALIIGSSTIWIGSESFLTMVFAAIGVGVLIVERTSNRLSF